MLHLERGLAYKRSQGSNEAVITEEKGKGRMQIYFLERVMAYYLIIFLLHSDVQSLTSSSTL